MINCYHRRHSTISSLPAAEFATVKGFAACNASVLSRFTAVRAFSDTSMAAFDRGIRATLLTFLRECRANAFICNSPSTWAFLWCMMLCHAHVYRLPCASVKITQPLLIRRSISCMLPTCQCTARAMQTSAYLTMQLTRHLFAIIITKFFLLLST